MDNSLPALPAAIDASSPCGPVSARQLAGWLPSGLPWVRGEQLGGLVCSPSWVINHAKAATVSLLLTGSLVLAASAVMAQQQNCTWKVINGERVYVCCDGNGYCWRSNP